MHKAFSVVIIVLLFLAKPYSLKGFVPNDSIFTFHQPNQNFFNFNSKLWTPRDTGLTQIQVYQPFLKYNNASVFSGNNGLAGRFFIPLVETNLGFRLENNVFEPYFFDSKNALYFDTKRPFTSIAYLQGVRKEQFLDITHTQNLNPRINIGFSYRLNKSDGFFAHQNTSYNNIRFFSCGRSRNGRINYLANAYTNRLLAYENWGVDTANFELMGFVNKALLGVNNTSAKNNRNLTGAFLKTFLSLKKSFSDSMPDFKYRFFVEASISRYIRKYQDFQANKEFYGKLYNDSTFTLDTAIFQNLYAGVGIESHPQSKHNTRFLWSLKWGTEWFEVYNYYKKGILVNKIHPAQYLGGLQDFNNLIDFTSRLNDSYTFRYSGFYRLQYVLTGYNQQDHLIQVENRFALDTDKLNILNLNINHSRRRADYFHERYFANSINYSIDTLLQADKTKITIGLNKVDWKLSTGIHYLILDNYIYFNSLALPQQQTKTKNVNTFFVEKSLTFKKLNCLLWASYNQTNFKELRIPKTILRSSLFIQNRLFKQTALSQVGFDITYFSKTDGVSYNPELAQFFVSNTGSLFNYPFLDFFWNIKIVSFRAFVKLDHLNAGLFGNRYYVANHLPFYDRAIRLGIIWTFHY